MAKDKKKESKASAKSVKAVARTDVEPLSKGAKKQALYDLQEELVKLQRWVKETGARVIVVFEGRDTAGKGGTIKRMTARVSPRTFRVVALPSPTERQKSQMYIQRYVEHFPAAGEVVIFDRSWYNRAGVERVMGFASKKEIDAFFKQVITFEEAIIDSGIILIKYWLETSMENQQKSLQARITDGRKTWKLSKMDLEARRLWYDYSRARDDMFKHTDKDSSPWHVIPVTDRSRKGLNCIAHLLETIPYSDIPLEPVTLPEPDPPGDYIEPDYPYRFVPEKY